MNGENIPPSAEQKLANRIMNAWYTAFKNLRTHGPGHPMSVSSLTQFH